MSQKDEWMRRGRRNVCGTRVRAAESSAAGCGTIASESAQVCASLWGGPCVGTTIGAQTTNRRFSFTFRPPISIPAPPPSPTPVARTSFFTHFPLVETHGSHQGMTTLHHLLQTHNSSLMSLSSSTSKPPASPPEVGVKSEITVKVNF